MSHELISAKLVRAAFETYACSQPAVTQELPARLLLVSAQILLHRYTSIRLRSSPEMTKILQYLRHPKRQSAVLRSMLEPTLANLVREDPTKVFSVVPSVDDLLKSKYLVLRQEKRKVHME